MKNKFIVCSFIAMSTNAYSTENFYNLEQDFWNCDFMATQTFLNFDEATHCSKIFEELKDKKFKKDFSEFLKWWNLNKEIEYNKRKKKF